MQFNCGSCGILMEFNKGESDLIRCVCGQVNFVANTGKYATYAEY